jgi:hypothetical protein
MTLMGDMVTCSVELIYKHGATQFLERHGRPFDPSDVSSVRVASP